MKCEIEIKPDKEGYLKLKDALVFLKNKYGDVFVPGPLTEAIRNKEIPHKRSSKKKKARVFLKIADLEKWMKKNQNQFL